MTENEIATVVVDAATLVHRTLEGPGLLETVYEEALAFELESRGLPVVRQKPVPLMYKGRLLGLGSSPRLARGRASALSNAKRRLPGTACSKHRRSRTCGSQGSSSRSSSTSERRRWRMASIEWSADCKNEAPSSSALCAFALNSGRIQRAVLVIERPNPRNDTKRSSHRADAADKVRCFEKGTQALRGTVMPRKRRVGSGLRSRSAWR
jgi:hypothetical protein